MGWKQYFLAGLLLNVAQMVIAFLILVFQGKLPLNPLGFPGMNWDLAFNTVISFATNTNLQHYNGEATLSIFSQMTAIQFLAMDLRGNRNVHGYSICTGIHRWLQKLGKFSCRLRQNHNPNSVTNVPHSLSGLHRYGCSADS